MIGFQKKKGRPIQKEQAAFYRLIGIFNKMVNIYIKMGGTIMLKRMRRIGLFVLAIAVVISSAIIASANERSGTTTGSATAQTTASSYVIENKSSDKKDITVTIQHYNGSKKIYSDDVKTLSYGSKNQSITLKQ